LFLGLLATTVLSPSRCNRGFAEIFAEKIRRSQKAGELPTNGKHYMGILYNSLISLEARIRFHIKINLGITRSPGANRDKLIYMLSSTPESNTK